MGRKVKRFVGTTPIYPRLTENRELIVPVHAMRGWIRGMLKHFSGTQAISPRDLDILFATVQSLTDSRYANLKAEAQAAMAERLFNKFIPHAMKQRHPFQIVRVHADIISDCLLSEGFKHRLTDSQSLWIKKRLPLFYAKLNKAQHCSEACPAGSSAIELVAVSNNLGKMRNLILAHYHGTTTQNIEQLLAGR
jgi:hypothetical protein